MLCISMASIPVKCKVCRFIDFNWKWTWENIYKKKLKRVILLMCLGSSNINWKKVSKGEKGLKNFVCVWRGGGRSNLFNYCWQIRKKYMGSFCWNCLAGNFNYGAKHEKYTYFCDFIGWMANIWLFFTVFVQSRSVHMQSLYFFNLYDFILQPVIMHLWIIQQ